MRAAKHVARLGSWITAAVNCFSRGRCTRRRLAMNRWASEVCPAASLHRAGRIITCLSSPLHSSQALTKAAGNKRGIFLVAALPALFCALRCRDRRKCKLGKLTWKAARPLSSSDNEANIPRAGLFTLTCMENQGGTKKTTKPNTKMSVKCRWVQPFIFKLMMKESHWRRGKNRTQQNIPSLPFPVL